MWAAANSLNRVLSFEPSPKNISALAYNVRANRLESRVEVRCEAVGVSDCSGHFWLGPAHETGWGGLIPAAGANSVVVEIVSLDEALDGRSVDVLKIDTEGADTWVLTGACRSLAARRVQHVFFEDNPKRRVALGIPRWEAHRLLNTFGYNIKYLGDGQYHASI